MLYFTFSPEVLSKVVLFTSLAGVFPYPDMFQGVRDNVDEDRSKHVYGNNEKPDK